MSAEIIAALTIRAASRRIDSVTAPTYAQEVKFDTELMRIRFAMRFCDDRSDEEAPPPSVAARSTVPRLAVTGPGIVLRYLLTVHIDLKFSAVRSPDGRVLSTSFLVIPGTSSASCIQLRMDEFARKLADDEDRSR